MPSEVEVLIRPTATRLVPPGSDADPARPIEAVVRDVAYRGRGYEHVVECRYGVLTGVFDTRSWERGAACAVVIDPDGCLAFPV
jgi:hypothetical protein